MSNVSPAGRDAPSPQGSEANQTPLRQNPPRQLAEERVLGEKFAERLERESGRGPATGTLRDAAGRQLPGNGRQDRRDGDSGGEGQSGAAAVLSLQHSEASAAHQSAAERSGQLDRAVIERIAAQIAEGRPGSAGAEAQVHFAAGAAAQMAHLRMGADGSIAIRVSGLDPQLSALQQGQLRFALVDALRRRKLRIGELRFETTRPQPGRDEAMSRVV